MAVKLWRKDSLDEVGLTAVGGALWRSLCADGITSGDLISTTVISHHKDDNN